MQLTLMKCKLHRARVTACDLHYEGSIAIDRELMRAAGLIENERVEIWNVNNGQRLATYVVASAAGAREIVVNGAAARHFEVGDRIIVTAFAGVDTLEADRFVPTVVLLDDDNVILPPSPQPVGADHAGRGL